MIVEIGEIADRDRVEAAVCVVGAGPTGLALARELAAGGTATILVESGPLAPAPQSESLNQGETVGTHDAELVAGRARALGGTSRLWAGQCLPFDGLDFAPRGWVEPSGWPLSVEEVEPYLSRAERFFEVDGEPYDDRVWTHFGLTAPAFDPSRLRHLATVYTPEPDLGARFESELRRAPDLTVLLGATVVRIETADDGVTGVVARGFDGSQVKVRAGAVVLCAGAIENARLLLLSGGLGNDRDLVGRYFQDHPNAHVGTIASADPQGLLDRYGLLYRAPLRHFPKISLAPDLQQQAEVLHGIANLVFDFGADSGLEALKRLYRRRRDPEATESVKSDALRVLRDLPQLAGNARRLRAGLSPSAPGARISLQVHTEQAPDRSSRVQLGEGTDVLGMPSAVVDWKIGRQDVATARLLARTVAAEFARLGLGEVELADWLGDDDASGRFSGAFHYIGTTRMADEPAEGVVDRDCCVHGVTGLYCCGGSVFPTSGAANPTLTMVALALRLADHLNGARRP